MNENYDLVATHWSLIAKLKNPEDKESWDEFFKTYWKLIYGVAMKSGFCDAEAQEVVQETMLSVARTIEDFKADPAFGSFKKWLYKLTRWRIIDQVRKRGPELPIGSLHPGASDTSSGATSPEARIPDPKGNILEGIWEVEWKKHLLETALKTIEGRANPKHFKVFYQLMVENRSPTSVAQILGIPVGQVYLIKHRLLEAFEKVRLAEDGKTVQDLKNQVVKKPKLRAGRSPS